MTDIAVVGAGIAGVATAFFVLRDTTRRVLLIERDRVGRGATGHNAGQLTSYFERPLGDLVDEYGFEQAIAAQRAFDDANDLLDVMMAESGTQVRIERFIGHMGMFSLNHLQVHLRNGLLRQRGGLRVESCVISEDAAFLADIPSEYSSLYSVVPQARVRELLCTIDDRYCAVLSDRKGCANSALVVEQVLKFLQVRYPDRFRYVDHTPVGRIVLDSSGATLDAGSYQVAASHVVLCTNGFVDHVVENRAGDHISPGIHHQVSGTIGYMAAFVEDEPRHADAISYIRNSVIGDETPYIYVTRRTFDRPQGETTLTCIGGPERTMDSREAYDATSEFPASVLDEIDNNIRPIVQPGREQGLAYDYAWHGLMAYTRTRVRLIGFEPRNRVLMYNLGCNGVGFLPSIHGGHRIAYLLTGETLPPSIFDPP